VRTIAVHDSSGKVIGGVELFSDSDESVAIRQKLDELGRLALLDPLTGIANRRCLSMNLESRLDEHARYGWPFALLFADVDRFKRVNDLFGHATGDRVLKMVANAIQCGLRSFDLAGRWGGEEFVVLLAGTPPEAVRPSAERLRMLIEQSGLPANGADIRVTVTIGAVAATSGATADSMIDEADRLMYLGKKAGRNRVVVGGTAVVAD
jgi:diguanylate cyclase (GGDEF)-like protein